eukprot:c41258_g1_i1 orf=3-155(-)
MPMSTKQFTYPYLSLYHDILPPVPKLMPIHLQYIGLYDHFLFKISYNPIKA